METSFEVETARDTMAAALALHDSDSIHLSDEVLPGAPGPSDICSSEIENDFSDEDAAAIFQSESDGYNERTFNPHDGNPFNAAFFNSRVRPEWFQDDMDDDGVDDDFNGDIELYK